MKLALSTDSTSRTHTCARHTEKTSAPSGAQAKPNEPRPESNGPTFHAGILVQCDASIKSIIVSIDNANNNEFIIEVLDDQTIVVKETMLKILKERLEQRLQNTTQKVEDDDTDSGP